MKREEDEKRKHKLTPGLNIFHSKQSINPPAPTRGLDVYGFCSVRRLDWLLSIDAPASNINTTSFGLSHEKKKRKIKSSSLITVVGEQVALLQRATTIGNSGWYAAPEMFDKAIHGPVGHPSAAENASRRHIFTDLWPPLRRADAGVRGRRSSRTRAHTRLPYRLQLEKRV